MNLKLLAVGALLSVYIVLSLFFRNHYFLNTVINGKDFSGLKVEDVEEYFRQQVSDYKLEIKDVGHVIPVPLPTVYFV